jgi:hypothetical protein
VDLLPYLFSQHIYDAAGEGATTLEAARRWMIIPTTTRRARDHVGMKMILLQVFTKTHHNLEILLTHSGELVSGFQKGLEILLQLILK